MAAGESARQEARRARERAERLAHRAELFEKGADGESRTAGALDGLGAEWVVLHDHRWPGRRLANIDHIVIGPGGIFVIDSKNWSGDVRVAGQVLRQNSRSREKAVASAGDATLAVAELVPLCASFVRPALCFTQHAALSGWVRDVMICSPENVVRMLTSRPRVLGDTQIREVAAHLDVKLREASRAQTRAGSAQSPASARRSRGRPPSRGPRQATRKRSNASAARLLAVMGGGVALLVALQTGLVSAAAEAFAEAFVSDVASTTETCEAPKKPAKQPAKQTQESRATSC